MCMTLQVFKSMFISSVGNEWNTTDCQSDSTVAIHIHVFHRRGQPWFLLAEGGTSPAEATWSIEHSVNGLHWRSNVISFPSRTAGRANLLPSLPKETGEPKAVVWEYYLPNVCPSNAVRSPPCSPRLYHVFSTPKWVVRFDSTCCHPI